MFATALSALALTSVQLLILCLGDPKRRRSSGNKGRITTASQRRLLAVTASVPGVICVALGDAAALFIWLGGSALFGWALAAWFARAPRPTTT